MSITYHTLEYLDEEVHSCMLMYCKMFSKANATTRTISTEVLQVWQDIATQYNGFEPGRNAFVYLDHLVSQPKEGSTITQRWCLTDTRGRFIAGIVAMAGEAWESTRWVSLVVFRSVCQWWVHSEWDVQVKTLSDRLLSYLLSTWFSALIMSLTLIFLHGYLNILKHKLWNLLQQLTDIILQLIIDFEKYWSTVTNVRMFLPNACTLPKGAKPQFGRFRDKGCRKKLFRKPPCTISRCTTLIIFCWKK